MTLSFSVDLSLTIINEEKVTVNSFPELERMSLAVCFPVTRLGMGKFANLCDANLETGAGRHSPILSMIVSRIAVGY